MQEANSINLEAREIEKTFGATRALRRTSLTFRRGEITGLIGANGAGKSTLLRILGTLLEPDSGRVLLEGRATSGEFDPARKKVGLMLDDLQQLETLSPMEILEIVSHIYLTPRLPKNGYLREILSLWELDAYEHSPMRILSLGMKQKVWLSAALLSSPRVLLLDEPFTGLDLHSNEVLKRLLRLYADQGTTVVISSHLLAAVEEISDRIILLDRGEVLFDGPLQAMTSCSDLTSLISSRLIEVWKPADRALQLFNVLSGAGTRDA